MAFGTKGEGRKRRHDRLSDAQRDERVKIDADPEDALRALLGVKVPDSEEPEKESENND
jgi:hypothetical protein